MSRSLVPFLCLSLAEVSWRGGSWKRIPVPQGCSERKEEGENKTSSPVSVNRERKKNWKKETSTFVKFGIKLEISSRLARWSVGRASGVQPGQQWRLETRVHLAENWEALGVTNYSRDRKRYQPTAVITAHDFITGIVWYHVKEKSGRTLLLRCVFSWQKCMFKHSTRIFNNHSIIVVTIVILK